MKEVVYLGVFPPPYGGVTVKNVLITNEIERYTDIRRINLYKTINMPINTIRVLNAIVRNDILLVGLDSKRLRIIVRLLSAFHKTMERTSVFLMGGLAADIIIKDSLLSISLKKAKAVLVETNGMRNTLEKHGFNNVDVYPNCKSNEGSLRPETRNDMPIKMVFFSQVSEEKGILHVEKAIEKLESQKIPFELDVYGHIVREIETSFFNFIEKYECVNYRGVFDSTKKSVYEKLHEYDVLLFPSQWKAEGVPGVLIESKMAGIAVVASDVAYNTEIVDENNDEGIIIHGDYAEGLVNAIKLISDDRELLAKLKMGSYQSRLRYSTESYSYLLKKIIGFSDDLNCD